MRCAPLVVVLVLSSACQSSGDPRAEVVASYEFFAQWARGDVSESSFDERFPPLSAQFTSWTPPGSSRADATQIRAALRAQFAEDRGDDSRSIRIDDFRQVRLGRRHWLATFKQVSTVSGVARTCLVTAVLQRDAKRRHGLSWVHVHESWLDAQATEESR